MTLPNPTAKSSPGPTLGLALAPTPALDWRRTDTAGERHALAVVAHGPTAPQRDALTVDVPLPTLDRTPLAEVWWTRERPRLDEAHGFRLARTADLVFGAVETDGADIELAARNVYAALVALLGERDHPHLLRVWNVVPRIAERGRGDDAALDRYMLFCRGRSQALCDAWGTGFEQELSAATAVGGTDPRFCVWFVASAAPGEHRENPRQTEAYRYPTRYGPRAPTFARATRLPQPLGTDLLLSGTASVLGSESAHVGHPERQLAETLRNIGALVGSEGEPDASQLPYLKVYVRRAADLAKLRAGLAALERAGSRITFVRADVCRPELLVEIEGIARPAATAPLVTSSHARGRGGE